MVSQHQLEVHNKKTGKNQCNTLQSKNVQRAGTFFASPWIAMLAIQAESNDSAL